MLRLLVCEETHVYHVNYVQGVINAYLQQTTDLLKTNNGLPMRRSFILNNLLKNLLTTNNEVSYSA